MKGIRIPLDPGQELVVFVPSGENYYNGQKVNLAFCLLFL